MSLPSDPTVSLPQPGAGQYNAYLSDLSALGGRYVSINSLYLAVVSALIGLLSLKGDGATKASQALQYCVPLFGIGVCIAWHQAVARYRALFAAKFTVLKEMEDSLRIFPAFKEERRHYQASTPSWLLNNDSAIPIFLSLPFVVVLGVALFS